MFILDTNVLSNAMAAHPAPAVAAWIAGQPLELLFTASICQAEILSGIAILPQGPEVDEVIARLVERSRAGNASARELKEA
jgi:predicted nucleic acid-binding protein